MSQLSVKEHLDGILSDFEALKRSFDMEDAEDAPAFSTSSPPHSHLSPSLPSVILATGNGEGRRGGGPIPPPCQSRISLSSDPSPAQSPVLKTRITSSLSFNRGTVHLARANGSHLTRVSSFQTRLNPNGFSSSLGPGSDNESLHSSSSSLECPTPVKSLPNVTSQTESLGLGVSQLPSPMLKKFFSHGNVFHAEADRPVQSDNCSSLPSLDLHIAEDPGPTSGLYPTLTTDSSVTQSASDQNCTTPLSKTSTTKESSVPPLEISQFAHVTPPAPAARQTVKLQKFPISLDGLMEKTAEAVVLPPAHDSPPKPLPRAQIHVNLSTSPSMPRQLAEIIKEDRAVPVGAGFATPSPGRFPRAPNSASPPQPASYRLVPPPQIGQVASQPTFLGHPLTGPTQGTPATGGPREHSSATAKRIDSIPSQEAAQLQTPAPAPWAKEDPLTLANRPQEASSEKKESERKALLKEESSPGPLWIRMEGQPVRGPLSLDAPAPGIGDREQFGYTGIDAVLDQMRNKTMKTGFEFNIMVVGQSGLGKSTMVNTLFKSKVSRKSCPGYEETIPKTVQLLSVTHVIEEKGVRMKLTVTDTPGFGDQINNQNCWEPILEYINDQYERYLREENLINRKRRIPDTRVHACVYFVPPTGHWLRPLDLEFMQRLSKITNVVPVIAKADALTLEERAEFKQRIQKDLKVHGIHVYPQEEFDEDADDRFLNDKIREKIPFAVVGADKEHQVNGKKVLGRKTKWGIIEVENLAHCEFPLLQDLLIRSHLQDLKDITHNVHYERYRMYRLGNLPTKCSEQLGSINGEPESHL